jgi:hypothetical protein
LDNNRPDEMPLFLDNNRPDEMPQKVTIFLYACIVCITVYLL